MKVVVTRWEDDAPIYNTRFLAFATHYGYKRAMQRAVHYRAYGFAALERILSHQATPKPGWQQLDEGSQEALARLSSSEPIGSRHSREYQHLLDGISTNQGNDNDETGQANSGETDHHTNERSDASAIDPPTSASIEDPAQ